MSILKLLSAWRADSSIGTNIEDWHKIPASPAKSVPFPKNLHPALASALQKTGIDTLYSHQSASWEHIQAGRNVAVVTATASGKTLCYNLPVLDRLARDTQGRALYIFPTKALSQDQAASLKNIFEAAPRLPAKDHDETYNLVDIPLGIYDGDTPQHARPALRSRVRLMVSNPDMLHFGILPHHPSWAKFFGNLRFVVIDEMHTYRGVFGSHVANVLRRLKRITHFYGARPQFILTSATIANPRELAERLTGEEIALVDEDGSERGTKHFLIYNPPVIDRDLGLRRSALQEGVRLAEDLLVYDIQTLIFGRSRHTVELILTYLRGRIFTSSEPLFDADGFSKESIQPVRGYRGGYLPRERREIERGLRRGDVRVAVATNALELGIDIGGMDAVVLVGYPGTIASTWQQAGRAGRGEEPSLAVLITTAAPLDQFLATHPDYLFQRSPEHALINPDNLLILLDHLRCATFELPFQAGDRFGDLDPDLLIEFLEILGGESVLYKSGTKYFWMADQYPAQDISLRSASTQTVTLQTYDNGAPVIVGQVDQASARWMVHPQAVYMHEGQSYIVEDLDLDQNLADLRRSATEYYTEPRRETTVQLLEEFDQTQVNGCAIRHGEIMVTSQLTGFRKIRWFTHERIGQEDITLPPTDLLTTAYWLTLTEDTINHLREQGLWRSDPNNYGPNWRDQRQRARVRDGRRCQVCGEIEGGREHDVHHKTPFRSFPSYQQANQLANLVTLCQPCHRRAETAVRVRSGLAGLAFVIGHLAPFFLMCDSRDLGVHADPKSPLGEGLPTVVLYDQVPAGIGLSQRLFELHQELIMRARDLVSACKCTDGCPSCVGPGGELGSGGKPETLAILKMLSGEVS